MLQILHSRVLGMLAIFAGGVFLMAPSAASAAVTVYTDEVEFEAAVAALDLEVTKEGFEDDAAWDATRVYIGQSSAGPVSSVTNNGFTWTSNIEGQQIATGNGPVRTGDFGFFALPHGNVNPVSIWIPEPTKDGFIIESDATMHAFGGWFETNTYGADLSFIIDDTIVIDFDDSSKLNYYHKFYGVISTEGFTKVEPQEQEGMSDDWKLIFADDFTMATGDIAPVVVADPAPVADSVVVDPVVTEPVVTEPTVPVVDTAPVGDLVAQISDALRAEETRLTGTGQNAAAEIVATILESLSSIITDSVVSDGFVTVNKETTVTITGVNVDGAALSLSYSLFDVEEIGEAESQISEEDSETVYEAKDDSFEVLLSVAL